MSQVPKRRMKKKERKWSEMAQSMSQQMLYIMPAMTTIISLTFPSRLALYWVVYHRFPWSSNILSRSRRS